MLENISCGTDRQFTQLSSMSPLVPANDDRHMGVMEDKVADTAQDGPSDGPQTSRSHDNQCCVPFLSNPQEALTGRGRVLDGHPGVVKLGEQKQIKPA